MSRDNERALQADPHKRVYPAPLYPGEVKIEPVYANTFKILDFSVDPAQDGLVADIDSFSDVVSLECFLEENVGDCPRKLTQYVNKKKCVVNLDCRWAHALHLNTPMREVNLWSTGKLRMTQPLKEHCVTTRSLYLPKDAASNVRSTGVPSWSTKVLCVRGAKHSTGPSVERSKSKRHTFSRFSVPLIEHMPPFLTGFFMQYDLLKSARLVMNGVERQAWSKTFLDNISEVVAVNGVWFVHMPLDNLDTRKTTVCGALKRSRMRACNVDLTLEVALQRSVDSVDINFVFPTLVGATNADIDQFVFEPWSEHVLATVDEADKPVQTREKETN